MCLPNCKSIALRVKLKTHGHKGKIKDIQYVSQSFNTYFCMQVFFVESICDDLEIITENIKVSQRYVFLKCKCLQRMYCSQLVSKTVFPLQQVKFGSPDYVDCDIDEAMEDFSHRIDCYRASYIPIDDEKDRCSPMMLFFL